MKSIALKNVDSIYVSEGEAQFILRNQYSKFAKLYSLYSGCEEVIFILYTAISKTKIQSRIKNINLSFDVDGCCIEVTMTYT